MNFTCGALRVIKKVQLDAEVPWRCCWQQRRRRLLNFIKEIGGGRSFHSQRPLAYVLASARFYFGLYLFIAADALSSRLNCVTSSGHLPNFYWPLGLLRKTRGPHFSSVIVSTGTLVVEVTSSGPRDTQHLTTTARNKRTTHHCPRFGKVVGYVVGWGTRPPLTTTA